MRVFFLWTHLKDVLGESNKTFQGNWKKNLKKCLILINLFVFYRDLLTPIEQPPLFESKVGFYKDKEKVCNTSIFFLVQLRFSWFSLFFLFTFTDSSQINLNWGFFTNFHTSFGATGNSVWHKKLKFRSERKK